MNQNKSILRRYILEPLIAFVTTVLTSILVYYLNVPTPVIILLVLMIFFTAIVSILSGGVSAIYILLYALFFYSKDHVCFRFDADGLYRFLVAIVSTVVIFLLVAWIRRRGNIAYQKLEKKNETLEEESTRDPLTGLYNRRGGDEKVNSILEKSGNKNIEAISAILDIDDFKDINDRYGHSTGDEALCVFGDAFEETFQDNSILIRTGGDEFTLFHAGNLPEFEQKLIEFSKKKFTFEYEKHTINFTISCGYSYLENNNPKLALQEADAALYQAKEKGKHIACKYQKGTSLEAMIQGFSTRGIAENLPVSFLIYRADKTEKILLASNSLLKLCECQDFSEFMQMTGGTFRGFVYPDDLDETEKSIEKQIVVNHAEMDSVHYRIKTKTGKILEIHDLGHLVHDENLGNLFYLAIYDKGITLAE